MNDLKLVRWLLILLILPLGLAMCSKESFRYPCQNPANWDKDFCQKCNEGDLDISCYDFHHVDPSKKEFNLSGLNSAKINWNKVKEELDKCLLLCSNCHRTEHSNYKSKKFLSYINKLDKNFFD